MSEKSESKSAKDRTAFSREVGAKAARKLKARRNSTPGVWFGLGMMGLVGWSVAVPTLLGAALGIWLDKRHPGQPFLDPGAVGGRACDRLFQCLDLDCQRRQGHAGGTGG